MFVVKLKLLTVFTWILGWKMGSSLFTDHCAICYKALVLLTFASMPYNPNLMSKCTDFPINARAPQGSDV